MDYKRPITVDGRRHFGKPCVSDTRILVEQVLELIQEGIPFSEIITTYYPDLTMEDIKACTAYARDLVRGEAIHFESV